ncbi:MAG: SGNH/GDSL hydrolase family protein, partial [Pseudobutyrivibrio sp.]|nr:SGNH/GDSL hydrolase family protein [Pseudobutyrivibrio sp.]
TYDGGLHLNLAGAEKLSKYFGEILSNDMNVPDRRGDEKLTKYWDSVEKRYNAEIKRQTDNLEKFGNVHGDTED